MRFHRAVSVVQALALALAGVAIVMLFVHQPPPAPTPAARAEAASAVAGPGGTAAAAPDGRALYAEQCAACHGDAGEGSYGPAFRGGAMVTAFPSASDQAVVVAGGRPGTSMRGFADKLTPEQIDAVVAYTRGL